MSVQTITSITPSDIVDLATYFGIENPKEVVWTDLDRDGEIDLDREELPPSLKLRQLLFPVARHDGKALSVSACDIQAHKAEVETYQSQPLLSGGLTLASGVRVVVEHVEGQTAIRGMVSVAVGGRDGGLGFAHATEHALLSQDGRLAGVALRLESQGAHDIEGRTTADVTCYPFVMNPSDRKTAFPALADQLANRGFDDSSIQNELRVALPQEVEMFSNSVLDFASGEAIKGLYSRLEPRVRDVGGTPLDFNWAGAAEMAAFHERYYGANTVTVAFVGPISLKDAVELVQGSGLAKLPPVPLSPTFSPKREKLHAVQTVYSASPAGVPQMGETVATVQWAIDGWFDFSEKERAAAQWVVSYLHEALDTGSLSEIREESDYGNNGATLGLTLVGESVKVREAMERLHRLLSRLQTKGPEEGELGKARSRYLLNETTARATDQRGWLYRLMYLSRDIANPFAYQRATVEAMRGMERAMAQEGAQRFDLQSSATVVVLGDEAKPAPWWQQLIKGWAKGAPEAVAWAHLPSRVEALYSPIDPAASPTATPNCPCATETPPPSEGAVASKAVRPSPSQITLESGLTLTRIPMAGEEASLGIAVRWDEKTMGPPFLRAAYVELIKGWAKTQNPTLGHCALEVVEDANGFTLLLNGPSSSWQGAVPGVLKSLSTIKWTAQDWKTGVSRMNERIQSPESWELAKWMTLQGLYPDLLNPSLPTPPKFSSAIAEALTALHTRSFSPAQMHVGVAGPEAAVQSPSLEKLLATTFVTREMSHISEPTELEGATPALPPHTRPLTPDELDRLGFRGVSFSRALITERPSTTTTVVWAAEGPDAGTPTFAAAQSFAWSFDNQMCARTRDGVSINGDSSPSLVYTIRGWAPRVGHKMATRVGFMAEPDQISAVVDAIRDEIRKLADPNNDAELNRRIQAGKTAWWFKLQDEAETARSRALAACEEWRAPLFPNNPPNNPLTRVASPEAQNAALSTLATDPQTKAAIRTVYSPLAGSTGLSLHIIGQLPSAGHEETGN